MGQVSEGIKAATDYLISHPDQRGAVRDAFNEQWNDKWQQIGDWFGGFPAGLGNFWYSISGAKAQNDYNTAMYERQTADNARLAAEQRAWEERMSNTTYQRSVDDMRRAGLNPAMLSGLTSGSAVSTGSGAAASAGSASSSSGTSNGIIGSLALIIAALSRGKLKVK